MGKESENKINKPILLVIEETKRNLIDVINNSNLATFILEPIIDNLLNEIRASIKNEYDLQKSQYEKMLKEHEDEKEGK